jgi:hypothetical protein
VSKAGFIPNLIQNTELMTSIFEEKLRRKTPAVASAAAKFSEQIFTKNDAGRRPSNLNSLKK